LKVHERGAVADAVREVVERSKGRPVRRAVLMLGPGVEPASVELYWRELAAGTSAADAALVCEYALDGLVCTECQEPYLGTRLDLCPRCGGEGLITSPAPEVPSQG
jgi:Zn finger protein HypA/HybF involved in hydrogenase expression